MDQSKVNITGSIACPKNYVMAEADLAGKKHTILPATMMVEGAYYPNVSNMIEPQSLYFSAKELKQSVNTWNVRPVYINHPESDSDVGGPDIYNKHYIGHVFNTRYDDETRSLKSELWIDNDRGKNITNRIKMGENIDVSIGAFGDIIKPDLNVTAGTTDLKYDFSMTNIVGDHLAVLPDGVGACSWKDGCGIRASVYALRVDSEEVEAEEVNAVMDRARRPSFSGTETISWGSVNKSLGAYIDGYYKSKGKSNPGIKSLDNLPSPCKSWIASKSLLGVSTATNARELLFFPVVNPMTNKLNAGALRAVLSGRGSQANISEGARSSAQSMAKKLLESNFKSEVKSNIMTDVMPDEYKDCTGTVNVSAVRERELFDKEKWMAEAPREVRDYVLNSLKCYDQKREAHIKNIKSCEVFKFCEKELGKISDLNTIEGISLLVDCVKKKEDDNKKIVEANKNYDVGVDYQMMAQASRNKDNVISYAEFKDINFEDIGEFGKNARVNK